MNKFGYYAFGEGGRWNAYVAPLSSRRYKFYITATEGKHLAIKTLGVSFKFTELPEGDHAEDPTLVSTFEGPGELDLEGFLRAVVDCAASMGIYPSGAKDTTKELAALRSHLEDMRALVGVRAKEVGAIRS